MKRIAIVLLMALWLALIFGCSKPTPTLSPEKLSKCTYEDILQLANAAVEAGDPKKLDAEERKSALPKLSPECRKALSGENKTPPVLMPRLDLQDEKKVKGDVQAFLKFVTEDALEKTLRSFPLTNLSDLVDPKTKLKPAVGAPKGTPIKDVISEDIIADSRVRDQVKKGATFGGKERITEIPLKGNSRAVKVKLASFPLASPQEGVRRVDVSSILDGNFLIYLPSEYMVATSSSMHRELYPHDTSYVIEALLRRPSQKNLNRVRSILEAFAFEVNNMGFVLNGNRGYYLTRSQTNNLPTNVWQYYTAAKDAGVGDAKLWLEEVGIPLAKAVYAYWQVGDGTIRLAEGMKGNRWIAHGNGPCQEVWESHGTHKAYYFRALDELVGLKEIPDEQRPEYAKGFGYERVVKVLSKKKEEHLEKIGSIEGSQGLEDRMYILPGKYTKSGKDEPVIETEAGAYYIFTPLYYLSDRASRVSGYDSNHLYGPFNAFTIDFVPVAHNVQLYRHEKDIASMLREVSREEEAKEWDAKAKSRKKMIFATMWDDEKGMLFDYDARTRRMRTPYPFASSAYALWAGLFDPKNSGEREMLKRMVEYVEKNLESPNGLYASGVETGLHWDKPFCWPIQQGMVVWGLREYAKVINKTDEKLALKMNALADRIALKYLKANYRKWLRSKGKEIQEKVGPDKGVFTGYENQANYTWNLAAVWDLYSGLAEPAKENFHAYLALNPTPAEQMTNR